MVAIVSAEPHRIAVVMPRPIPRSSIGTLPSLFAHKRRPGVFIVEMLESAYHKNVKNTINTNEKSKVIQGEKNMASIRYTGVDAGIIDSPQDNIWRKEAYNDGYSTSCFIDEPGRCG